MLVLLTPHPDTPSKAISRIEVEITRGAATLALRYRVFGKLSRLRSPDLERHGRAEGLWRSTCFEAFVKPDDGEGYLECNFAGHQWATYQFTGYRQGMTEAVVEPGFIEGGAGWLSSEIEPGRFARPAPYWRVGLSAVIEEVDGVLSYWALAHPAGKPDFHHPDSFALTLLPPEPA
jgi:hypothetical protein